MRYGEDEMQSGEEKALEVSKKERNVRPYPANSLEASVEIAKAIHEKGGGQPLDRIMLAKAIGRTPASSAFRSLVTSSAKYGLTEGNYNSPEIKITNLGEALVAATTPEEKSGALMEAALKPAVFRKFYTDLDGKKLPENEYAENILRRKYNVPAELCKECISIIKKNGEYIGLITNVKGSSYVSMRGVKSVKEFHEEPSIVQEEQALEEVEEAPTPPPMREEPKAERKIFIGHGKNTKPVEQLEKVLQQFQIPYTIAVEEPNRGRPISTKVAETMRECSAAILLFTCDEEFQTADGRTIWRPSENVIHELGAASVLYEQSIVIFREEGIDLPTNFKDLGYISFEKDKLDAKGLDLIKELIAFGLVKVTV